MEYRNKKEVIKLKNYTKNEFLNKEKTDAHDFVEIVVKVPKERKSEIEGIVNGFCLAASMLDNKKPTDDAVGA